MNWTSVIDGLPEIGAWVQVYEDDNDNPHEASIEKVMGSFRQQVSAARLLNIDAEGSPYWYLCYIGGGPVSHVRNVTHWKSLSLPPSIEEKP